MPHAVVLDVPASWEHYEPVAAVLGDCVPHGLILHVAGPTEEGFRTIEIWETREAWAQARSVRITDLVAVAVESRFAPAVIRELPVLSTVRGRAQSKERR